MGDPVAMTDPDPATLDASGRFRLRTATTAQLTDDDLRSIRALMDEAFTADADGPFTDDDWDHALGGVHVIGELGGEIVAHASVVERELHVAGRPLRTGYLEAVATRPARQREGWGSRVVARATELVRERYELGALGTGVQPFYERFGWRTWRGRSSVRTSDGERPTPDDDGYLMVLATPASPPLDWTARLSCDWRPGDVW